MRHLAPPPSCGRAPCGIRAEVFCMPVRSLRDNDTLPGIRRLFRDLILWKPGAIHAFSHRGRAFRAPVKAEMLEQEFDRFAEEYEQLHARVITASGEGPDFFASYKPADVRRHLERTGRSIEGLSILDFGCGVGGSLPYFRRHFPDAELMGVDVSRKSLAIAELRYPGVAHLVHLSEAADLPVPEAGIDVVFSACVFHHIPAAEHHRILGDLRRVLKPGGWLFVFEHNPFNPLTRRAVDACPFDENAVLIGAGELKRRLTEAGFREAKICYRLFFPRALRWLRGLEAGLTWCPLGAQYYVAARRPA
jgi:ubiquinone/menaquinone biosynthesis C-methylase UbiE